MKDKIRANKKANKYSTFGKNKKTVENLNHFNKKEFEKKQKIPIKINQIHIQMKIQSFCFGFSILLTSGSGVLVKSEYSILVKCTEKCSYKTYTICYYLNWKFNSVKNVEQQ